MTTRPGLLHQLDREWDQLAATPKMHHFVIDLASRHDSWQFTTADGLLEAARTDPNDGTPSVLARLVGAAIAGDDLAFRTAIQAMLPRWWTIATSLSGIPIHEAIDLVVDLGTTQIRTCDPDTATTPMGYRLWCNTRRAAIRAVQRLRATTRSTVAFGPEHDRGVVDHQDRPDDLAVQIHTRLVDRVLATGLVDATVATQIAGNVQTRLVTNSGWVYNPGVTVTPPTPDQIVAAIDAGLDRELRRRLGSAECVDDTTLDLIIDTRVHGSTLADRARAANVNLSTLRKRRHRAERRLRAALAG